MLRAVLEAITGMEEAQAVDILYIALLERQPECVLLCQEMHGVERFGLCLGEWRDVGAALLGEIARELAARVLDDHMAILKV